MSIPVTIRAMQAAGIEADKILDAVLVIEEDRLERERTKQRRYEGRKWTDLRQEAFERDGEICGYCEDQGGPFCVDHMVPLSRGGANELDNLIVCCRSCNSSKGDKTIDEWKGGRN